jgi:anti-anti-sigma regulatory factor
MLRITIHDEPDAVRLQLEGKVTGGLVSEFDRTWRSLAPSLGSKKLIVDLREVIHMDAEARGLLAEIHKKTGADFIANTPMAKYFADEARRRSKREEK